MSDIKTITVNGTQYDIKDATARADCSDLKSAIEDNVYTTNILFSGDVVAEGTSTYVYTDVLILTDFSAGDTFSFDAESVTGATSNTPFYIYVRNGDTNVNSSINGSITVTAANIEAGADRILFRFYPATGTALPTGTATAKKCVIRHLNEVGLTIASPFLNAIRSQAVNDLLVINNIETTDYISKLQNSVYSYRQSKNLAPSWSTEKVLNADGTETANSSYATSAFFPVIPGNKIVYTRQMTGTTRGAERYYAVFYAENKTTVVAAYTTMTSSATVVPVGASYAKVCIYNAYATTSSYKSMVEYTDGTSVTPYYEAYYAPYWYFSPSATMQYRGKKICVFGDSLAASGNGGTDSWIQRVSDALGFSEAYNRGVGGSMVTDGTTMYAYVDADGDAYNRGSYTTHQTFAGYTEINACLSSADRANTIPTDTDVIIILAGANDVGSIGSAGQGEFTAKYKQMLDNIYDRVPDALVYLCTMPFHLAFDTGPSASTYEAYREIIRTIGHEYGFPVIDLKREMFVNKNNYTDFMNDDHVHYNTEAGRDRTSEAAIPHLFGFMYM